MQLRFPKITVLLLPFIYSIVAAQTMPDPLVSICKLKNSDVATIYCPELENEYKNKLFEKKGYPDGAPLIDLRADQIAFVGVLYPQAYKNVVIAKGKAAADAALQSAVDNLAQWLSSKGAHSQPGSGSNSSGSTTLTAKPTTTDLISLAAESGAFTDTQNGTTLTAQANADGLRRYLTNQNFSPIEKTSFAEDLFRHTTAAATFQVAQNGATNASTTGTATPSAPSNILTVLVPSNNLTFSSIGGTLQIYRPYTPTSTAFRQSWKDAIKSYTSKNGLKVYENYVSTAEKINKFSELKTSGSTVDSARNTWLTAAEKAEEDNNFSEFVDAFLDYANVFINEIRKGDSTFDDDVLQATADIIAIRDVRNQILDKARGLLATVTYTYSTPPGKPATHDATAVLSYVWKNVDKGAQLTGNFGGSWFASVPVGASYRQLKDYQFSGEFDQPLPPAQKVKGQWVSNADPKATFSLAGYGQYQYAPNVLNLNITNVAPGTNITVPANSQVFTSTKGWLGIAQAKLTFNVGKGASIPLAVKWSNKTDLLDKPDWKGQFGVSYDLSAIASILNPKSGN